ncbi:site-specific DNA-methyltransferase [Campylobacter upsaliensis]|nr:site-specific DNA-methyltransferase [Campylobacter upsaliensis]EAI9907501.1 site-specific DNA-methyltransferase [Campylobacter upsaliensis]EAJ0411840.1 site-specific DNA-methyltransferase [Campylobacter upsaliensis]EAJ4316932.1 site-specific DNA-methyltransferase [Campylobacter upsaliensis]EAJ4318457.1 site-specific DNA-methyltransferase [Campylobacter upsaliensis]
MANFIICDPFSGSSTTGIATNLLHRQFVGIEKESEFINLSIKRKNELDAKFEEFKNKLKDLQQTFF